FSYADTQSTPSKPWSMQPQDRIRTAVAKTTRRALGPDGKPSCYLDYLEADYDGLPNGQVGRGNPTRQGIYSTPSGYSSLSCTTSAAVESVKQTRYTDPGCPGQATESEDPLGAITMTRYDPTCSFVLRMTNALGHTMT